MTIDKERVARLREMIRTGHLHVIGNLADVAVILNILDDYQETKAEAELELARPLLAVVDKCEVEDLEYCVNLYKDNPDPDPALDIVRAALAYRNAKNAKKGETA